MSVSGYSVEGAARYVRMNPGCTKSAVRRAGWAYEAVQAAIERGLIRAERPKAHGRYYLHPGETGGKPPPP